MKPQKEGRVGNFRFSVNNGLVFCWNLAILVLKVAGILSKVTDFKVDGLH